MEKLLKKINPFIYKDNYNFSFSELYDEGIAEKIFLPSNNVKLNLIRYLVFLLKKIEEFKYYENLNIKIINNERPITLKNCIKHNNQYFLLNPIFNKNSLIEKINYGNINLQNKVKHIFILINTKKEILNDIKELINTNYHFTIFCNYDKFTKQK